MCTIIGSPGRETTLNGFAMTVRMTIRQEIVRILVEGEWTAGELSRAVHIPQKEVYGHLEHIMRTCKQSLRIVPAKCLTCGFTFHKRRSVCPPSRCPICKREHIQDPAFALEGY